MSILHWHRWLLALLVLAPGLAMADEPGGNNPEREALFDKLDTDKNGSLSADEIPEAQKRLFERLLRSSDKDKNGELTREEFLAATKEEPRRPAEDRPREGGQEAAERFKQLDKNGDGKLSEDEVPEERRQGFARLLEFADKDGDKALTFTEFTTGMARARGDGGQQPRRPDGPPDGRRPPPPPATAGMLFRALDTDADGMLSASEIAAASSALKKLDRNEDGSISRSEAGLAGPETAGGRGEPRGPREGGMPDARFIIERNDKNSDKKLSKEEAPEWMVRVFERIDTNGDTFIDIAEIEQAARNMRAAGGDRPRGPGGDRPGGPGGDRPRGPGGDRPGQGGGAQFFKQLDKNGDGKLSKDEAPERMRERFDDIDANSDGFIEPAELAKAFERSRDRQPPRD